MKSRVFESVGLNSSSGVSLNSDTSKNNINEASCVKPTKSEEPGTSTITDSEINLSDRIIINIASLQESLRMSNTIEGIPINVTEQLSNLSTPQKTMSRWKMLKEETDSLSTYKAINILPLQVNGHRQLGDNMELTHEVKKELAEKVLPVEENFTTNQEKEKMVCSLLAKETKQNKLTARQVQLRKERLQRFKKCNS